MDHHAVLNGAKTGNGLTKCLLSAASNAGHAKDLAAANIEVHMVNGGRTLIVSDGEVPNFQKGPGLFHNRTLNVQINFPAYHKFGKLLLAGAGGVHCADVLPLAEDGYPVGKFQNLIELVGDDNDGVA